MAAMQPSSPAPRRRTGCLLTLAWFLLFGTCAVLAWTAFTAPWAYFLGGRFHVLPVWQGFGVLAASGRQDYLVFVRLWPDLAARHARGNALVSGMAALCIPGGRHYELRLAGSLGRDVPRDTEGLASHLYAFRRPWLSVDSEADRRPQIDLYGTWRGNALAVNDHGSLAAALREDGTLNSQPILSAANARQGLLRAAARSDFDAACAAAGSCASLACR
jgi:hypothetical protein